MQFTRDGSEAVEPSLPGAEAYLEAIYVLTVEEPQGRVLSARVAEYLGVSPVSVSKALTRLQKSGDVSERTPVVKLSAQGFARAEAVVRRHRLAERWLADRLGFNLVEAHREAERLEHALSGRVEAALWEELGRPSTCPHGNPIPGSGAALPLVQPLSDTDTGLFVIERIFEQLEGLENFLAWIDHEGLLPGTRLRIEGNADPDGGRLVTRVLARDCTVMAAPILVPGPVARRILVRIPDQAEQAWPTWPHFEDKTADRSNCIP